MTLTCLSSALTLFDQPSDPTCACVAVVPLAPARPSLFVALLPTAMSAYQGCVAATVPEFVTYLKHWPEVRVRLMS